MADSEQPQMNDEPLLVLDDLSVAYNTERGQLQALRNVSLQLKQGEVLGIAGESGSGKSTLALSVLQYLGDNGQVTEGDILFKDESLLELSRKQLADIRGKEVAHVPQNPQRSLNPSMVVGEQISETIHRHRDCSKAEAKEQAMSMLETVQIPQPSDAFNQYPHQLSGGMQQRIAVAIALSCNPDLLILDEPTTGLDVTTEAKILALIEDLIDDYETGVLLITHDIGVLSEVADRLAILYGGSLMESGTTAEVIGQPAHPYTVGLLNAVPRIDTDAVPTPIPGSVPDLVDLPTGCIFADRCSHATEECRIGEVPSKPVNETTGHESACLEWEAVQAEYPQDQNSTPQMQSSEHNELLLEVNNLKKYYDEPTAIDRLLESKNAAKAVDDVSFEVREGETVALVGESGCGKSTLGRTLLGLLPRTAGEIRFRGTDIQTMQSEDGQEFHSECQIVFQDPGSSLNPRKTVQDAVERPLKLFTEMDKADRIERVIEILEEVGLSRDYIQRYPNELSGGEKQRVAIARAFVSNPSLVVLDEPVSALDVSIQASILELLSDLQDQYGTSYLLISHDLSVVNYISDQVLVMYLGKIVEKGSKKEVFEPPFHPYTKVLLTSIPSIDPTNQTDPITLEGDVPSPRSPPIGCSFHPRCPQKIGEECEGCDPGLESRKSGGKIACLRDESELS
jgi:oligopeptide/dipeptide ABC transporter ATP-binding protein